MFAVPQANPSALTKHPVKETELLKYTKIGLQQKNTVTVNPETVVIRNVQISMKLLHNSVPPTVNPNQSQPLTKPLNCVRLCDKRLISMNAKEHRGTSIT